MSWPQPDANREFMRCRHYSRFFLSIREITRFVQFIVLAIAIAVVFYTPTIVETLAKGIANALGVH